MLPSFCTHEVTVIRPKYVDVRGTEEPDFSDPTEMPVTGCLVTFSATKADRDGRLAVEVTATLHAPPDADIRPGDRVRYDSAVYELLGEPLRHRSPTGAIDYVECEMARWSG